MAACLGKGFTGACGRKQYSIGVFFYCHQRGGLHFIELFYVQVAQNLPYLVFLTVHLGKGTQICGFCRVADVLAKNSLYIKRAQNYGALFIFGECNILITVFLSVPLAKSLQPQLYNCVLHGGAARALPWLLRLQYPVSICR